METVADGEVFYLAEVAVYVGKKVRKLGGLFVHAEIVMEFRVAQDFPDVVPDSG
jgi:hypothetical protein